MYDFVGKVVVVTRCCSLVGNAIARRFARHGAYLAINANENVPELTEEIKKLSGFEPLFVKGDIAKPGLPKQFLEQTLERFGALDVLINNAGGYPIARNLDSDYLMSEFDYVMRLNVRVPLDLIRHAHKHMKTRGVVVNISSISSMYPVRISCLWELLKLSGFLFFCREASRAAPPRQLSIC